jgi:trans-2,3-dihydro-3-hydroxyanthranilate isomerase
MKQQPPKVLYTVPADLVAEALGLDAGALELYDWVPTVMKTEVAHLMVPIKNNDYLKQAIPNNDFLKNISVQYGFEGFYLFTTNSSEKGYIAETRFFNPAFGINEDPATGTAAGPLAGYLSFVNHILQGESYQILQGVLVNHASSIQVKVMPEGIWVSGSSVIVMEGELVI